MRGDSVETNVVAGEGGFSQTRAALKLGDTLAGRFVLHDRLGRGGSGTVFSALDTRVGDRIAVKILDGAAHDPTNRERLRREIRATRSGRPTSCPSTSSTKRTVSSSSPWSSWKARTCGQRSKIASVSSSIS